jgi:hypothetical protein
MTTSERDKANKDIGSLEKRHAEAKDNVLAQVHRVLPNATKEWEQLETERIRAEVEAKKHAKVQRAAAQAQTEANRQARRELMKKFEKPVIIGGLALGCVLFCACLCSFMPNIWTPKKPEDVAMVRQRIVGNWKHEGIVIGADPVWEFKDSGDATFPHRFQAAYQGKWEVRDVDTIVLKPNNLPPVSYKINWEGNDRLNLAEQGDGLIRMNYVLVRAKVGGNLGKSEKQGAVKAPIEGVEDTLKKKLEPIHERAGQARRKGRDLYDNKRYAEALQSFTEAVQHYQEIQVIAPSRGTSLMRGGNGVGRRMPL